MSGPIVYSPSYSGYPGGYPSSMGYSSYPIGDSNPYTSSYPYSGSAYGSPMPYSLPSSGYSDPYSILPATSVNPYSPDSSDPYAMAPYSTSNYSMGSYAGYPPMPSEYGSPYSDPNASQQGGGFFGSIFSAIGNFFGSIFGGGNNNTQAQQSASSSSSSASAPAGANGPNGPNEPLGYDPYIDPNSPYYNGDNASQDPASVGVYAPVNPGGGYDFSSDDSSGDSSS